MSPLTEETILNRLKTISESEKKLDGQNIHVECFKGETWCKVCRAFEQFANSRSNLQNFPELEEPTLQTGWQEKNCYSVEEFGRNIITYWSLFDLTSFCSPQLINKYKETCLEKIVMPHNICYTLRPSSFSENVNAFCQDMINDFYTHRGTKTPDDKKRKVQFKDEVDVCFYPTAAYEEYCDFDGDWYLPMTTRFTPRSLFEEHDFRYSSMETMQHLSPEINSQEFLNDWHSHVRQYRRVALNIVARPFKPILKKPHMELQPDTKYFYPDYPIHIAPNKAGVRRLINYPALLYYAKLNAKLNVATEPPKCEEYRPKIKPQNYGSYSLRFEFGMNVQWAINHSYDYKMLEFFRRTGLGSDGGHLALLKTILEGQIQDATCPPTQEDHKYLEKKHEYKVETEQDSESEDECDIDTLYEDEDPYGAYWYLDLLDRQAAFRKLYKKSVEPVLPHMGSITWNYFP